MDELFSAAPALGAPLLAARFPRAWLDLNRAEDELDPRLIQGIAGHSGSPRILSGLGVIPRVVSEGRHIYRNRLSREEAEARIARAWKPYHRLLRRLLRDTRARFGRALLIDCHSMPHNAIHDGPARERPRPDIVLGDRFGAAADAMIVEMVEEAFVAAGFGVARNTPFAGAYTVDAYGRPSLQTHVIQIEIDRSLYMDERSITRRPDFADFRRRVTAVMTDIISAMQERPRMAAE